MDRQAPIKPDFFIEATHGHDNHQDKFHHYWHACNERENSLEEPAFEDENTQFNANTSILQREQVPCSQCNFGVLSTALEFINRLPPTTLDCMTGFNTPGSQPCRKPGRGQRDTKKQTPYFPPKCHLYHRSEAVSHSETQPQLGMEESPHLSDDDSDPTYKDIFRTTVVAEQISVRCSGRSVSIPTSTTWRMGLGVRAALTPHLRFVTSNKPRMVPTTGLGSEHTPTHHPTNNHMNKLPP